MKQYSFLLFFFFFSFSVGSMYAQDSLKTDLKVGVVLSGGGAKGLAHIGALKVIEEAGVRIDYIAGTSMGAIIGSLYAAGYTSHQLDSIFRETNFNTLIQDDLPRAVKTFYEKEDSQRYALTLPFDDFKVSFPSGLSRGQNIYNLIFQLTMHLNNVRDFSQLPIPFFCIGTDVETGEEVILDHGSLAQAVSASGAIPTLFSPVSIDGRLITDGGVSNNYPVEELQKKDVDFIIGVDVQDSLVNRERLHSAFEILTQINNFRTIKAMKTKRGLTDLYIKPDIRDYTILSFNEGSGIIKNGEEAAEKHIESLKEIASKQTPNFEDVKREKIKQKDSIFIRGIQITGNTSYPRNYIRGKLKIGINEPTTYKKLNRGINNLSATGNFKRVEYRLIPRKDGGNDLRLLVYENSNNTNLRLAVHYDELYKSAALFNITRKSLLVKNDITSLDVILGDNFRYNFKYYIDKGSYWSIGIKSHLNEFGNSMSFSFVKNNFPISDFNVNKLDVNYLDFTNQFYVETFFIKTFRLGLGAEHKYTKLKTETIIEHQSDNDKLPVTVLEQSNLFSAFGYLEFDNYNNAYFPSKGAHFRGDFSLYLFDANSSFAFTEFSIAKGSLGYAVSPFRKLALRLSTETGLRIGENEMNTLNFFLGGYGNNYVNNIKPFLGYNFTQITGDSYIKALAEVDYEIFRKNHIIASYNIANVEDDLYKTGNWLSTPDYSGIALGYGVETFIGPIELKYSYSPEVKTSQWYFSLGFWF